MSKNRKHEGTIADAMPGRSALILRVIGNRPDDAPYLSIHLPGNGPVLATVDNANALRGLANAILRSLAAREEP